MKAGRQSAYQSQELHNTGKNDRIELLLKHLESIEPVGGTGDSDIMQDWAKEEEAQKLKRVGWRNFIADLVRGLIILTRLGNPFFFTDSKR